MNSRPGRSMIAPGMLVGIVVVTAMCVTAASAGAGGPVQLERYWNALVAVALFVVLLVILGRYAWKPVLRAMQAREQALADIVSETERRRTEGEEMLAQYRTRLEAAEEDVASMLHRAQEEAEKTREDIVQHARRQAAASIAEAERQILAAKQEALKEIYRSTADLATDMAGKIVRKEITAADQDRLIEESLERLGEDEQ